ncbi:unnamed protein product [Ambrosiozyma monospora]|uniref:Unnamed protein product n=1 Tax=Ambrosiozyma monospora TaxID=43982 RepID=A0A9W6YVZ1_AMBMO|nr:unnamed protein product [Ambrosiozyma monospora]
MDHNSYGVRHQQTSYCEVSIMSTLNRLDSQSSQIDLFMKRRTTQNVPSPKERNYLKQLADLEANDQPPSVDDEYKKKSLTPQEYMRQLSYSRGDSIYRANRRASQAQATHSQPDLVINTTADKLRQELSNARTMSYSEFPPPQPVPTNSVPSAGTFNSINSEGKHSTKKLLSSFKKEAQHVGSELPMKLKRTSRLFSVSSRKVDQGYELQQEEQSESHSSHFYSHSQQKSRKVLSHFKSDKNKSSANKSPKKPKRLTSKLVFGEPQHPPLQQNQTASSPTYVDHRQQQHQQPQQTQQQQYANYRESLPNNPQQHDDFQQLGQQNQHQQKQLPFPTLQQQHQEPPQSQSLLNSNPYENHISTATVIPENSDQFLTELSTSSFNNPPLSYNNSFVASHPIKRDSFDSFNTSMTSSSNSLLASPAVRQAPSFSSANNTHIGTGPSHTVSNVPYSNSIQPSKVTSPRNGSPSITCPTQLGSPVSGFHLRSSNGSESGIRPRSASSVSKNVRPIKTNMKFSPVFRRKSEASQKRSDSIGEVSVPSALSESREPGFTRGVKHSGNHTIKEGDTESSGWLSSSSDDDSDYTRDLSKDTRRSSSTSYSSTNFNCSL